MLTIRTQRHIKLATVERPTAWIVVAFLVETTGNETKIISGPKIVKVIQKKSCTLPGRKNSSIFALPSPFVFAKKEISIESPYVSAIFGYTNSDVVMGLAAQPPTFA